MTKLTKPQHRLTTIASLLGILQGTAWIVMSLICIVEYLKSKSSSNLPPSDPSYMDTFNWAVYLYFLNANIVSPFIINADSFTIFMWIYLITDIIWVVLSILQLRSIYQIQSNPVNLLKCWGVITSLIACIDFLLVVLIAADYNENCMPSYTDAVQEGSCTNLLIPVLIIAAKGFVLWIVNVCFVYVIYKIGRTIQSGKNLNRNLLNADPQIPRATLQSPTNNWPNQPNWSNQNNWANQSAPNNNGNFWNNNPRPVSYDGRTPPTSPAYYPTQQQHQQQQQSFSPY